MSGRDRRWTLNTAAAATAKPGPATDRTGKGARRPERQLTLIAEAITGDFRRTESPQHLDSLSSSSATHASVDCPSPVSLVLPEATPAGVVAPDEELLASDESRVEDVLSPLPIPMCVTSYKRHPNAY